MPKDHKVIHKRHVISRILKAASDAKYPVECIEFAMDGTIVMRPKPDAGAEPVTGNDEQGWDKAIHAAHEKRTA
jgi:hypothetical protein